MATAIRLKCGICRSSYKIPKILSCFHSFCEACLESHISRARPNPKFQCPLCRAEIGIPEGGARSLQTNYYIETVEEGIKEKEVSILCDNCDDEQRQVATKYCKVCRQQICENCALLHEKLKITKSHELYGLDRVDDKRSHKKPCSNNCAGLAESYCQNCNEFLCAICRTQGHAKHVIEDIKTAAERRNKEIQKTLEESETYISLTHKKLEIIQDLKSVVKAHEMKAVETLETKANALKEQINNGVKELSLEITQYCEKELLELNRIEQSMTSALDNHEAINKWILNSSDEEMLAEGAMMQRKIMAVNASVPSYVPPVSLVTFTVRTDTKLTAEKLGSVKIQKTSSDVSKIEMELINTFCLRDSWQMIKSILSYKNKQMLMVHQGIKGLCLYDEHGVKRSQMLKDLAIMAVDSDSDLNMFASVSNENNLYKISTDWTWTIFCTLPIIPVSIAACPDGRVVVCSEKSERLFVIDRSGTNIRCIQLNKGSFKLLKCIAVCKYTNILAVCDEKVRFPDNSFHVTVHLFDYRGETINSIEHLPVHCVMSDDRGHFLLGQNEGVIVIDTVGNKLANLICSKHSVQALCLAVDTVNQLWIGSNGRITLFKCPNISISATLTK